MSDYKTTLTSEEWYGFKRTQPEEYRIIKNYIRDANWYPPIRYGGIQFVELVIPRRWFTFGQMLGFLSKHRHLGEYEFIDYEERPHYKGGTYTTIGIDYEAVPMNVMCDYMWLEVRRLLARNKNLLSSRIEDG